jgi:hypothetical protein
MHKAILLVALLASTAVASNATTWVATCNDGKNIQYVQTVNGAGYLYLKANKDFYQTARLSQTFAGDAVVCGTVQANSPAGAEPITQVCIDKSRHTISLKYVTPGSAGHAALDAGEYCAATVTLRATNLKDQ